MFRIRTPKSHSYPSHSYPSHSYPSHSYPSHSYLSVPALVPKNQLLRYTYNVNDNINNIYLLPLNWILYSFRMVFMKM
jgi:hypothetical protein